MRTTDLIVSGDPLVARGSPCSSTCARGGFSAAGWNTPAAVRPSIRRFTLASIEHPSRALRVPPGCPSGALLTGARLRRRAAYRMDALRACSATRAQLCGPLGKLLPSIGAAAIACRLALPGRPFVFALIGHHLHNDATHLVVVDARQASSFRSAFRSATLLVGDALRLARTTRAKRSDRVPHGVTFCAGVLHAADPRGSGTWSPGAPGVQNRWVSHRTSRPVGPSTAVPHLRNC